MLKIGVLHIYVVILMRSISMNFPKIEKIFAKYLTDSISATELDILSKWVEMTENTEEFETYIKLNFAINSCMSEYNLEKSKQDLLNKIRKDKKLIYRFNFKEYLKYAAIGLVFLGAGYLFQQNFLIEVKTNKIVSVEGKVTLQLDNGSIEVLPENTESLTENVKDYRTAIGDNKNEAKELVYNTLRVPYGKKFQVVLADGTSVYVNSGSSLKYPVTFIKGLNREVFLTGEAYFDVAEDKSTPFIVSTNELNIRVYGTKFVISSYVEDVNMNTVLLEGSVGLFKKGEDFNAENGSLLTPGHKATWNKMEKNIVMEEVDTSLYTDWMNGKVIFNHTPFKNILKKLERHYNISITNYNKELDEEFFTASFDLETIEEVFSAFNKSYEMNYKINEKEILINPK